MVPTYLAKFMVATTAPSTLVKMGQDATMARRRRRKCRKH